MTRKSVHEFNNFSGGIDRRHGLINRDDTHCYDLLNFQITPGMALKRRVPCGKLTGELADPNSFYIDGFITSFLPFGDPATHTVTGAPAPLRILYYDLPPFCTSAGEVIAAETLSGVPIALIRHTDVNNAVSLWLHVFDEPDARTHYTYISDGAPPAFWKSRLPQHPYGTDKPGTPVVDGYGARLTVDGGRAIVSLPDGDHGYSAINRARVFNERTAEQILQDGRWWYVVNPVSGSNVFNVDVPYDDIAGGKYAAYGMEALDTTGTWQSVGATIAFATQNGIPSTQVSFSASTYIGRPHRFILRSKPLATIISGCVLQPNGDISAGLIAYKGATVTTPAIKANLFATGGISAGSLNTAYYGFNPDTFVYVWSRTQPLDGTVICALAQFSVSSGSTLSGTLTFSGVNVTGTGTTFTTDFSVGDYINVVGYGNRKITGITDNTHLAVDIPFQIPLGGSAPLAAQYGKPSVPAFTLPGTYSTVSGSTLLHVISATLPANALLNTTVTAGAETRTVTSLSTDGVTADIVCSAAFTVTANSLTVSYQPTYVNNYQFGDTGTPDYAIQEANAVLLAGFDDAGFINSSQYDRSSGVSSAIISSQNRLFIQYPHSIQMWNMNPTQDPAFLSRQEIGSGDIPYPKPQRIDDGVIFPTVQGPRIFYPHSEAKDYLGYIPVGDYLFGITLPLFEQAVWWQEQNVFITCAQSNGGEFWVLSYNKQSKVMGWGRWTVATVSNVDRMFVAGGKLLFLQDGEVYMFDPSSSVFKDVGLDGATPYNSYYKSLYSDLKAPSFNKRLTRMDVQQVGTGKFDVYVSAVDTADKALQGPDLAVYKNPVISGYTQGVCKVPIAAYGPVLAIEVQSTDQTGYELYSVMFDYMLAKR